MTTDKKIEDEFINESKDLVRQSLVLLEDIEGDFAKVKSLAEFGNLIDRIMGGSRSMAMMGTEKAEVLNIVGDYAELCKSVAYKTASLDDNSQLFDVCVALLLDATETLDKILDNMDKSGLEIKELFSDAFIERLRWASQQFASNAPSSVGATSSEQMAQAEIDDLLTKLGF